MSDERGSSLPVLGEQQPSITSVSRPLDGRTLRERGAFHVQLRDFEVPFKLP